MKKIILIFLFIQSATASSCFIQSFPYIIRGTEDTKSLIEKSTCNASIQIDFNKILYATQGTISNQQIITLLKRNYDQDIKVGPNKIKILTL